MSRFVGSGWCWPLIIAAGAWAAIVVSLDPAGDHPRSLAGPGLTVDEGFDVAQGVALADRLLSFDLAGFRAIDARLPDHPPLGRIGIGLCHELAFLVWPPANREVPYSVACARTGSATVFAVLVFLVGVSAGRWYGRMGGACSALAVVFMPRSFGHAHLAALETMVNLTTMATVLLVASRWTVPSPPASTTGADAEPIATTSWTRVLQIAALAGLVFGLALLTKVQAVLLPIPIGLWALWHLRWRGAAMIAVWGLTGALVFVALWPHLWESPVDHITGYLGRATDRAVLYVWYFGQVIADRDVPWHYPWLMFAATVPVGLLALGLCGLFGPTRQAWRSPREQLVLACVLFPLCVFSVPGVAVYDGERLFSFVFPLWALFVGRGAVVVGNRISRWCSARMATAGLVMFLAAQSYGLWTLAPCWLSYYSAAVGGLRGASRMGLEISYWGDGLTRELLLETANRVPRGATVAVLPTLHAAQWNELRVQCPALQARDVQLVPWGAEGASRADYVLLFVRPEYLPEEFRAPLDERRVLAAVRREGVVLAALIDRR